MATFEERAAEVDSAVWAVLTEQMGFLTPDNISAVMAGATTSIARLVYHTLAEPGVTQTVEAVREMTCVAAAAIHKEALANGR